MKLSKLSISLPIIAGVLITFGLLADFYRNQTELGQCIMRNSITLNKMDRIKGKLACYKEFKDQIPEYFRGTENGNKKR